MKPNFIPHPVAAGLPLAATNRSMAVPARQHPVGGGVEAINCAIRTFLLKANDGTAPLTFVWNDSTPFTKKDGCAKCGLDFGHSVRVS